MYNMINLQILSCCGFPFRILSRMTGAGPMMRGAIPEAVQDSGIRLNNSPRDNLPKKMKK